MSAKFTRGELLQVRPHDDRDPEALKHAGKVVTFKHYGVTPYFVCVDLDGRNFYFRDLDLIPPQKEMAL